MIAKVLNMLIELKGNNYYSKVFKRVNYKLQNNTFWVVIIIPLVGFPLDCLMVTFLGMSCSDCSFESTWLEGNTMEPIGNQVDSPTLSDDLSDTKSDTNRSDEVVEMFRV